MDHMIVTSLVSPEADVVAGLARVGVATAHEAMNRSGLMQPYLRPISSGARIAGRAVTVLAQAGDNLMIHAAVEHCQPGDVMVVATMSPCSDGMFGELLATAVRARGVIGLVTDSGVRDVAELVDMRFPVWARSISAQGTVKASPGSVNVPVTVAGASVRPGDVILADDDGVLVVPIESAAATLSGSLTRIAHERDLRDALAAGKSSLDLLDLRRVLDQLGVKQA